MKSYIVIGRIEDGENQIFTVDDTSSRSAVSEFKKLIRRENEVGRDAAIYIDAVIEVQGKFRVITTY